MPDYTFKDLSVHQYLLAFLPEMFLKLCLAIRLPLVLRPCPVSLSSEAGTIKKESPRSPGPVLHRKDSSCDTATTYGQKSDSDAGRHAADQRKWSSQCGFENGEDRVLGQ